MTLRDALAKLALWLTGVSLLALCLIDVVIAPFVGFLGGLL